MFHDEQIDGKKAYIRTQNMILDMKKENALKNFEDMSSKAELKQVNKALDVETRKAKMEKQMIKKSKEIKEAEEDKQAKARRANL
jgi:hypothetical protein